MYDFEVRYTCTSAPNMLMSFNTAIIISKKLQKKYPQFKLLQWISRFVRQLRSSHVVWLLTLVVCCIYVTTSSLTVANVFNTELALAQNTNTTCDNGYWGPDCMNLCGECYISKPTSKCFNLLISNLFMSVGKLHIPSKLKDKLPTEWPDF